MFNERRLQGTKLAVFSYRENATSKEMGSILVEVKPSRSANTFTGLEVRAIRLANRCTRDARHEPGTISRTAAKAGCTFNGAGRV